MATTAQNLKDATNNNLLPKAAALVAKVDPKLSVLDAMVLKAEGYAQDAERSAIACAAAVNGTGGGSTGGTGGTGGTGSTGGSGTTTAAQAVIAKVKAAAALAPKTPGAIPRTTNVTVTNGSANRPPDQIPGANGQYERHWISGDGRMGSADLLTKAVVRSLESSAPGYGGAIQFQSNDSSSAHGYMQGAAIAGRSGDISDFGIGVNFNGRAIGICSSDKRSGNLYVDDGSGIKLVPGRQSWTGDGSYVYYDFGTAAQRKVYFRGGSDGVWGEIAIKPGDVITPFDFLDPWYQMAWTGDSWGQSNAFASIGLSLPQMMGAMIGSAYLVGSTIGGTGYLMTGNDNGEVLPNAMGAPRRAAFNVGDSLVGFFELGINDGMSSAFVDAVNTVLNNARVDNPDMILCPISWCSAEDRASGGGAEVQRRDVVKAKIMSMSGNWIYIDCFEGKWYTSKGTSRATGRGPMITGNGSAETPSGTGNANTWIDNNGGRHLTNGVGTIGAATYFGDLFREAIASM